MKVDMVAIENVDYVSKKTGDRVVGSKLHFLRPLSEREKSHGVLGEKMVDSVFTRLDTSSIQPNRKYELVYECSGGMYAELVEIKAVA